MAHDALIGLGSFLFMLLMVFLGFPLFLCMITAGVIGFCLISGLNFAMVQFTNAPYTLASTYSFAVIPMFILMGSLVGDVGIGEGAYLAIRNWVGKMRGGILMATLGANMIFGACCGMSAAASILFTRLALPELEKYGYNKRISLSCIIAAGSLSSLIPPSVPIIMTCILTNVSIGKALLAGIGPGVLTASLLALMVWVIGKIRPHDIPVVATKITWAERFSSLRLLLPILFLFVVVIGGIYAGVFPPTTAGAIGAFFVFMFGIIRRGGKKKKFGSFWEMAVMNGQIFPLIISGYIFGRMIALSGLANYFSEMIATVQLSPMIVMGLVIIFYIFCGCIMDIMSIIIITLPIVFPILTAIGFNELAVVIIIIFMGEIAALTPPVGMGVFIIASVSKTEPTEIFKGIIPFFLVEMAVVVLLIIFPSISTWIPDLLFK